MRSWHGISHAVSRRVRPTMHVRALPSPGMRTAATIDLPLHAIGQSGRTRLARVHGVQTADHKTLSEHLGNLCKRSVELQQSTLEVAATPPGFAES
jgi:hypothetical protein